MISLRTLRVTEKATSKRVIKELQLHRSVCDTVPYAAQFSVPHKSRIPNTISNVDLPCTTIFDNLFQPLFESFGNLGVLLNHVCLF